MPNSNSVLFENQIERKHKEVENIFKPAYKIKHSSGIVDNFDITFTLSQVTNASHLKEYIQILSEWLKRDYDLTAPKHKSQTLPHIEQSIENSKYILDLEDDWDDEGARATNSNTYNRAISFLREYSNYIYSKYITLISAPKIDILRDGSIGINWETQNATFLIIFDISNENLSYCYGKNKIKNIPFKTAISNDGNPDENVAIWMKLNLKI